MRELPKQLVHLGDAVELDGTEWVWKWILKDRARLYSSVSGKSLFIVLDRALGKKKTQVDESKRKFTAARKLYERFQDFDAEKATKVSLKKHGGLERAGEGIHIKYVSDKWGDIDQGYIHHFDEGIRIWVDSTLKPAIIGISGPSLTVTKAGIEG